MAVTNRGWQRRTAGLLTVCSLLLVALAGCGNSDAPQAASGQAGELAPTGEVLQSIWDDLGGTPEQYVAGDFIVWHRFQDPIADCMRDEGFNYVPPAFEYFTTLNGTGGDSADTFQTVYFDAPADDLGVMADFAGDRETEQPTGNPGYIDLTAEQKDNYDEALDRTCQDASKDYADVGRPETASQVIVELRLLLNEVAQTLDEEVTAYQACMEEAGYPDATPDTLREESNLRFSGADGETSQSWQRAVAWDQAAAEADGKCRSDLYQKGIAAAEKPLNDWVADNQDVLAKVQDEWSEILNEAEEYQDWPAISDQIK